MTAPFPTDDPTWDLDPIFEGGVDSPQFSQEVADLGQVVADLRERLEDLEIGDEVDEQSLGKWRAFFDDYFQAGARAQEAGSFSRALASAHADDPKAVRMPSRMDEVYTALRTIRVDVQAAFRGLEDAQFSAFVDDERFADMELWLRELRRDADAAMDTGLERLAVELNQDGLHAWSRLYFQLSGRLEVAVDAEGQDRPMSLAQAKNLLDNPDRAVRKAAFEGLVEAWRTVAPTCASALHSIVGTRQTLYRRRGQNELTEALQANRVDEAIVDAMHQAAREFRPLLVRFLQTKAKLLGLDRLQWYDLGAPVGGGGEELISYQEAQQFIVDQAHKFSPKIGDFCRHALANRWVEAEDRAGKRQGGYCTSLPVSKEIRIFMTFGGTNSGVTTLAHELGHGYHGHVMRDLPLSERYLPMGLAETASTFLEAVVEDAALAQAEQQQKLKLLDERLMRGVVFLMNIPARFKLERAMHSHRAKETLHEGLLTELATEIFEEEFGDGVASVEPMFWASKLHFFLSQMPFYNFPYTFGYLFSRAVYRRARQEGEPFLERIDALLRDTGRKLSDEIAREYLDADLRDKDFWIEAAAPLKEDFEQYQMLASQQ